MVEVIVALTLTLLLPVRLHLRHVLLALFGLKGAVPPAVRLGLRGVVLALVGSAGAVPPAVRLALRDILLACTLLSSSMQPPLRISRFEVLASLVSLSLCISCETGLSLRVSFKTGLGRRVVCHWRPQQKLTNTTHRSGLSVSGLSESKHGRRTARTRRRNP
jgi:hypothetical protein